MNDTHSEKCEGFVMFTFSKIITKLLNDYKNILRKYLDDDLWTEKVNQLGLKRKALRDVKDVDLFHKAKTIVEDLSKWTRTDTTASWYSGIDEFCQHLKNLLEEYQIENDKVVHSSQKASCAMVEAIQLMKLPNSRLNSAIAHQLDLCGKTIARYGTREQQDFFAKALKNYQGSDINFFLPIQSNFEKHLQDFTAIFSSEKRMTQNYVAD